MVIEWWPEFSTSNFHRRERWCVIIGIPLKRWSSADFWKLPACVGYKKDASQMYTWTLEQAKHTLCLVSSTFTTCFPLSASQRHSRQISQSILFTLTITQYSLWCFMTALCILNPNWRSSSYTTWFPWPLCRRHFFMKVMRFACSRQEFRGNMNNSVMGKLDN